MAIEDIRIKVDMLDHPKIKLLRKNLGAEGPLCLIRLWCHAARYCHDGKFNGDDEELEAAAGWDGETGRFVDELRVRRLLDGNTLHDFRHHQPWIAGAEKRSAWAKKMNKQRWDNRLKIGKNAAESVPDPQRSKNLSVSGPPYPSYPIPSSPIPSLPKDQKIKRSESTNKEIDPQHFECATHLFKRILEHRQPRVSEKDLGGWANEVRLMVERDKRTVEDIHQMIDECHDMEPSSRGFTWRDNILSMSKLRKQWNDGKIGLGMLERPAYPKGFVPCQ